MEILTLTFACHPTPEQAKQIDRWLDLSRTLWNFGLEKLKELDDRCIWDKLSNEFVPCSRVYPVFGEKQKPKTLWSLIRELERDLRKFAKHDTKSFEKIGALIADAETHLNEGWGRACPISQDWVKPMLEKMGVQSKGGLSLCARADLLPSEELAEIPSKFRMGLLSLLDISWQEWRKSLGTNTKGEPKFRSRFRDRDAVNILYSGNLKKELKCVGERLKGIPILKELSVPGLNRWRDDSGKIPAIAGFRIIRRSEGCYQVQLSGEVKEKPNAAESKDAIGIDPGLVYKLSTSRGYRKPENKRADHQRWRYEQNLQAKLDHKLDHNALLWLRHPQRLKEEVSAFVPLSEESWQKLKAAKTLPEIIEAIGNYRFQRIKHRLPATKKQAKIKAKIKAHKAKDKSRRKAWDDAWTTLTARKFGYIAIEDGLQEERNRHRPEPISNDGGKTHEPNGAKRKAKFNRRLGEAAPGQTIALLARKAKRYGREFAKIPAMGTTINCPVCGTDNEPAIKMDDDNNRLYKCSCCGWEADRDIHAGVNIELAGFGNLPDVSLSPMSDKARTLSCKWQESHPDHPKPLWVNGFKDAAEKYGRDAYQKGIAGTFDGKDKAKGKGKKGDRRKPGGKGKQAS